MSTFYGGEQISQVVSVSGSTTTVAGRVLTLYTVPTGFYGVLKWIYNGRNTATYTSGGSNTDIYIIDANLSPLNSSNVPNLSYKVKDQLDSWFLQKKNFSPNQPTSAAGNDSTGLFNTYLSSGDRVVAVEFVSGQPVRWEGELHLFKKP